MTDPAIFDISSPWSNLWLISSAIFATVWTLAIAAALTAAAAVPYFVAKAMAAKSRHRMPRKNNRALLIAAVAVIILMASTVTGLAYGVGAAKNHNLIGHTNPANIETDLNKR